jgi:hypothetical protein
MLARNKHGIRRPAYQCVDIPDEYTHGLVVNSSPEGSLYVPYVLAELCILSLRLS